MVAIADPGESLVVADQVGEVAWEHLLVGAEEAFGLARPLGD